VPTDAINTALFALAQHPNPRSVLLIGGGLGRLPEQLLTMKIDRLDVVEIDPELLRLARRFGGLAATDARLHVQLADGRYFLKRTDQRYDVILANVPAPLSSLMNRFFTVEFFREAKSAMNPTGVLITSVLAAANYPGESVGRLSGSILRTLEAAFAEVLVGGKARGHVAALFNLVACMGLLCLALPGLLAVLPGMVSNRAVYPLFLFLVGLAGFLDGATFPPLVNAFRALGAERPGGWIYASDLAGAGIGALTTGTVLVPVLGTAVTLRLLAAVLAVALLSLFCVAPAVRAAARIDAG